MENQQGYVVMTFITIVLLILVIISLHSVRRAIQAQHETLKSIRNRIDPSEFKVIG